MIRSVVASSIASIAILWGILPACAQLEAQDRCKETAVKGMLDKPDLKKDTFYWLGRFAGEATGKSGDDAAPDALFAFEGITIPLSRTDVDHLLRPMLGSGDWQTMFQNRAAVLLMSGQEPIIKAWQDCLAEQGGGMTVYFQAVPGQNTALELHIDYRQPASGGELPTLRVARNLPIDPKLGKVLERSECLSRNYSYAPGQSCVVKLEAVSAWITGNVALPVTDGKTTKDITAYLPPRAVLRGEQKAWPTTKMSADWASAHPKDNPINVLSRYADEKTGARPWDISAQRDVEQGWSFVEGKRKMSPDDAYVLQSDGVRVEAKPSGAASAKDCLGGYRTDPAGKVLFMGIGLNVSQPGPAWCYVVVKATIARLVWDPPLAGGGAVAAAPVARRAAAPPSADAAERCQERFRSYDAQTGTYLGSDGNRRPCP